MSGSLPRGTEYELFVQEVYRRLYSVEGVKDTLIQHNITITGKSGATHQIDLYWEFTLAGIRHRVAVECKDYSSPVKKEKIAAFKGVLDDIAGNIQGIYACRSGYQSGALKFAESCGIQPMIIRSPTDKDWEGRIRDIDIEIHIRTTGNIKVNVEADNEWLKENMVMLKSEGKERDLPKFSGLNTETFIEDLGRDEIKSIYEYQNTLPTDEVGKNRKVEYEYEDAYLVCSGNRCKIKKLKVEYDVNECIDTICIKGDQVIAALVKNLLENSEKVIRVDGEVREC